MASPNLDVVRSLYAAWERGEFPPVELTDPEIEFDLAAVYPDQPVLRGLDAIRRFRDVSPWGASQRFEPERFFEVDDERVLVFVRATATGQQSGVPVEVHPAHEFTIRDGLVARVKVYLDRAEALKAAETSEQASLRENVELVRQAIEANRSDDIGTRLEAMLALWAPDAEWTSLLAALEPGSYRGHDGIRRYFNDLADSWEEWRNEPEEVFDVDAHTVFAAVRFRGVGKGSGVAVETLFGVVFVLSEGKLLRGRAYPSRGEALEAVGLKEE